MPSIELPHGVVSFRVAGPANSTAPPVLFVHPFLMNGSLWSGVADMLAAQGVRSYAPDWPLGAHLDPVRPGTDQSPRGIARQILSFIEELDLSHVTLVGGDTGGALCQFVLDTDSTWIGSVVLTNCDAFDTFPPFPFSILFRMLKGRTRMRVNLQPMRMRAFRHSRLGLGLLSHNLDAEQTRAWMQPSLENGAIRDDAIAFLKGAKGEDLLDVSTRLHHFGGAVTVMWGTEDRAFTLGLGKRLNEAFSHSRFVEVPGARTLLALDAPEQLADAIVATATATT